MDDIKVGEYVRTKYGVIARVKSTTMVDNIKFYNCDNVIYEDTEDTLDYISENDIEKGILKHSINPIDLIEVGDYVNRRLVLQVDYKNKNVCLLIPFTDTQANTNICWYGYEDIKTIVTKEQFESMEYKVGD